MAPIIIRLLPIGSFNTNKVEPQVSIITIRRGLKIVIKIVFKTPLRV